MGLSLSFCSACIDARAAAACAASNVKTMLR
jgi:hypothetical protein